MSVHLPQRLPHLRYVPPSGFLSPPTVCSALWLHGLVPSRSHVQGSLPFRGFSLRAATRHFRARVAPLSFASQQLTVPISHRSEDPCSTIVHQSEDRRPGPAAAAAGVHFEAFIHTKKRDFGLVLPAPSLAPLFGFRPPPGPHGHLGLRFPVAIRSRGSGCRPFEQARWPSCVLLSVFPVSASSPRLRADRPARGFEPLSGYPSSSALCAFVEIGRAHV